MELNPPGFFLDKNHFLDEEDYQDSTKTFSRNSTKDSYTDSPPNLCLALEETMDEVLEKHLQSKKTEPPPKRRGRKPVRPHDPIKKKTEEKDKYWLRAFRGYMKDCFLDFRSEMSPKDIEFWEEYLGPAGAPKKGNRFLSFGKRYKNYLFSNSSFVYYFTKWFLKYGEVELKKKYEPGSSIWFVYHDYASKELINYRPQEGSPLGGSPLSCASPPESFNEPNSEPFDFCMVGDDNEHFLESALSFI